MEYKIIASSSLGNCVVIENVMVDAGISFKRIDENADLSKIDILLITHRHGDHLKVPTLKKILEVNRRIKVFCNKDVALILSHNGIKHTLLELGSEVTIKDKNGGMVKFSAVNLYHDVPVYGFRITFDDFFDETKVFYATDTATLEGIVAKEYDYYFVETNYSEGNIDSFDEDRIIGTHLSREEAENFFVTMKKKTSVMIGLHRSSRNY